MAYPEDLALALMGNEQTDLASNPWFGGGSALLKQTPAPIGNSFWGSFLPPAIQGLAGGLSMGIGKGQVEAEAAKSSIGLGEYFKADTPEERAAIVAANPSLMEKNSRLLAAIETGEIVRDKQAKKELQNNITQQFLKENPEYVGDFLKSGEVNPPDSSGPQPDKYKLAGAPEWVRNENQWDKWLAGKKITQADERLKGSGKISDTQINKINQIPFFASEFDRLRGMIDQMSDNSLVRAAKGTLVPTSKEYEYMNQVNNIADLLAKEMGARASVYAMKNQVKTLSLKGLGSKEAQKQFIDNVEHIFFDEARNLGNAYSTIKGNDTVKQYLDETLTPILAARERKAGTPAPSQNEGVPQEVPPEMKQVISTQWQSIDQLPPGSPQRIEMTKKFLDVARQAGMNDATIKQLIGR